MLDIKPTQLTPSDFEIAKDTTKTAFNILVTLIAFFMVEVITIAFTGHLGDPAIIAGAGLGSMLMTIVGIAVTCGMNSALTTLISQSYGQNKMRLCGVYYNQARIMVTILFIPMFVIFLYSDHIFAALGFDPLICKYAKEVLLYKSPYLYFYSIFDATKRLLYNVGHSSLPMYIQVGTTIVHPLWCYLSLHYFEMGVKGPALAQSISTILNIVILSVCLSRIPEFKEVFFMPNRECLKGISNYFKLGVPSLLLIWFEWCAFEFLTFMSGYLDVASTGAQIILFNFQCLIYMPALSMSITNGSNIGKYIGKGDTLMAKRYASVSQKIMLVDIALQIVFVILLRSLVAVFYTDVTAVKGKVSETLVIVAFGQIFNQMQAAQQGIMRGLGQVTPAAFIAFTSYYIFAMPLGYIFAFSLGLGLNGLWLGMYSGQFVLCSLYQYWFTIRVDWDAKAREAQERTARDENLLSKEEHPSQATPETEKEIQLGSIQKYPQQDV